MKCLHPQRIYNKYIKQWMYVPCRHCDACRISSANGKANLLSKEMEKYLHKYFITLTYKNECVPFMSEGSNLICRLASPVYDNHNKNKLSYEVGLFPDLLNVMDFYYTPNGEKPLSSFPINDAIGVLFYKDYQNFIKRFSYYAKKQNFKFRTFGVGEYGDTSKRPHFHFVALSERPIDFQWLKDTVIKSWPFADWDRLDLQQCFKFATSGISSYLASYVNCDSDNGSFLSKKGIKQKTFRSATLDFGTNERDEDSIREFVKFFNNGEINKGNQRYFQVPKLQNGFMFSLESISPRIFYTYFSNPSGSSKVSFSDFTRRSRKVFAFYLYGGKHDPEKEVDKLCLNNVRSTDYTYFLAYKHYCNLFGLDLFDPDTHDNYISINYCALKKYASNLLYEQMLRYDPLNPSEYYRELCNTFVDDPQSEGCYFRRKRLGVPYGCLMSSREHSDVVNYVVKYKHKLVSKHYQKSNYA